MGAAGAEQERPAGALPVGYSRHEHTEPQLVFVDLRRLHQAGAVAPGATDTGGEPGEDNASDVSADGSADGSGRGVDRGFVGVHGRPPVAEHQLGRLDFSREVIGRLHHWDRDVDGAWFGVVDYVVPRVGDIRAGKPVTCGLVPAAALRPRMRQVEDKLRF